MTASRRSLLQVLFIGTLWVVLAAIYWAGLRGDFVFDDYVNIVNNPSLKLADGSLSSLPSAAMSGVSSPLGRPISMASFSLNFHFFGEAAFSFKLANLVIHLANAMLVFVLVQQLLRLMDEGRRDSQPWALPAGIATVWALHPQNATPVLYIVQRMTSLSAFFVFAALSLYLYGRLAGGRKALWAIAVSIGLCWPAAVLSKETGLVLPAYFFLCEWLLLGSFRTLPRAVKWSAAGAALGLFLILCWAKWGFITGGYAVRDFDLLERLMTQPRVLWFYVQQLLLPAPQVFGLFHDDIAVSRGLLAPPQTLLAIFALMGVAVLAFHQRARRPLFALAVFWFLASHMLESTLLPLEIAYEHRNYMASIGIFVWLGSLLGRASANSTWRVATVTLFASFVFFCGLVTSLRSSQWADEFQRTQVEVAHHPGSARANYQAANAMMQRTLDTGGGNPMAHHFIHFHLKRASELDKRSKAPLMGLLYLDCAAGIPKNHAVQEQLRERFASAPFTHTDRAVVQSLSALLVEDRLCLDGQEVKALIDASLSNPSADGPMRGLIYAVAMDYAAAKTRSIPLALSYAQAAVASDPANVPFRVNLIHLYIQSRRTEEAQLEYISLSRGSLSLSDKASMTKLEQLLNVGENAGAAR